MCDTSVMKPVGMLCMGTHIVPTHTSCIVDVTCTTATTESLKISITVPGMRKLCILQDVS